jgi:hypothetical protein
MAEIWKPQSWDVLEYWVSTILDEASDLLNHWEASFIEDMEVKVINKWPLTKAQQDKLESIYAEKTK